MRALFFAQKSTTSTGEDQSPSSAPASRRHIGPAPTALPDHNFKLLPDSADTFPVKLFLLILILFNFSAWASPNCDDYKFQGMVRLHDNAFFIHIHEGTLSEIRIHVPKSEELKFLPYHEELASGKFENGTFTNLDFAVPDDKQFLEKKGDCK